MKQFLKCIRDYFLKYEDPIITSANALDANYKLAKRLLEAETQNIMLSGDLAIEREENMGSQLQADIFQQALTNTFTEKRIQDFYDEADRLREEHDNAK